MARHPLVTLWPSAASSLCQNDSARILARMASIDQRKSSQDPINQYPKVRPFELSGSTAGCVTQYLPMSWDISQGRFNED